ncbi:hypothetical protein [Citrobacter freundii]|uniref:Uncharacterized protein n=1 Tax=Citrobacter freundii TaxID=546 RepID=A0A7G2IUJ2_CITFR|nr:hypothetical protein [Citrobacter freundii]
MRTERWNIFDVAIIGLGPAGAALARQLSGKNARDCVG